MASRSILGWYCSTRVPRIEVSLSRLTRAHTVKRHWPCVLRLRRATFANAFISLYWGRFQGCAQRHSTWEEGQGRWITLPGCSIKVYAEAEGKPPVSVCTVALRAWHDNSTRALCEYCVFFFSAIFHRNAQILSENKTSFERKLYVVNCSPNCIEHSTRRIEHRWVHRKLVAIIGQALDIFEKAIEIPPAHPNWTASNR